MRTMALVEFVTLDGVMQGFADDDPEGGFRYGGWGQWHPDQELAGIGGQGMSGDTAYLFGRRTYEEMIGFWPGQPDSNPMAANLNAARKYVVSRTLTDPTWHNTTVLDGELEPAVRGLKQQGDGAITVLGSRRLAQELLRLGLVDQMTLFVHPLLLGQGHRLFGDLDGPVALELTGHQATTAGNLVLTYRLPG